MKTSDQAFSKLPMSSMQPKDGDHVAHCGHIKTTKAHWHWWKPASPMPFKRDDGSAGVAHWLVACNNCFMAAQGDPERVYFLDDGKWDGDAPVIHENKQ